MPLYKSLRNDFLRRHYPHQVKGRSPLTSSQPTQLPAPLWFMHPLYTHPPPKNKTQNLPLFYPKFGAEKGYFFGGNAAWSI